MKIFKTLVLGDKVFVGIGAYFLHHINYKDGYLVLYIHKTKGNVKPYQCLEFYIPKNHLKSNKLKVGNVMIHLTEKDYREYMNQFIKSQIEL